MTKQIIGAQGEITIVKIGHAPADFTDMPKAARASGGWIISHSESGHHHVLTRGETRERTRDVPDGMKILYAILEEPGQLIQDAQAPHGHFDLPAGAYEFRISREYDPFAELARRVAD